MYGTTLQKFSHSQNFNRPTLSDHHIVRLRSKNNRDSFVAMIPWHCCCLPIYRWSDAIWDIVALYRVEIYFSRLEFYSHGLVLDFLIATAP